MLPIRFKTETILEICTSPPFLLMVTFSIAIIDREPLRGSSWGWGGEGEGEEWERERNLVVTIKLT